MTKQVTHKQNKRNGQDVQGILWKFFDRTEERRARRKRQYEQAFGAARDVN